MGKTVSGLTERAILHTSDDSKFRSKSKKVAKIDNNKKEFSGEKF